MRKFIIFVILLFLFFVVGCDFFDISPKEENKFELGDICDAATIKSNDDEFIVNKDSNPHDLINFIKKYFDDEFSFNMEADIKSNIDSIEIHSQLECVCNNSSNQINDSELDTHGTYILNKTKVNDTNLIMQLYFKPVNSSLYTVEIYEKNDEVVAGSSFKGSHEGIKDLPSMILASDEYASYYDLLYRYINEYNFGLYPQVLTEDKALINFKEYEYNKRFEITIYKNYTLLKVIDDLGLLNGGMKEENLEYDCNGETFIYINNNTGVIDKVIYQGKSVDRRLSYVEYNISVVREEYSNDKLNAKMKELDDYFDNIK